MNDWISIADAIPPIGQEVLVFVPKRAENGRNPVTALSRFIRHEAAVDFYWDNNYGGSNIHLMDSVTHWMPMPEAPTDPALQLAEARKLLRTASIKMANWLAPGDDPRKQIIEFLERTR